MSAMEIFQQLWLSAVTAHQLSVPHHLSFAAIFHCVVGFSGLQIGQGWKRWNNRFHHGQLCLSVWCLN
jgi:hypothetical protein